MAIATGPKKEVRAKKESSFNVAAGATGAQQYRRVTSDLTLVKDTYRSAEIVTHNQTLDMRHGARRSEGTLRGELSPSSYSAFMQSALRRDFTTGATTGAITTVTAAAGPPGTFTRSAGSFLTDGFKVGDVVRWTGWTTTGVNNNARNYRITVLTATVMTVTGTGNEVVAAKAAGDSVTCTVVGKKTFIPATGHTNDSYSIEHWHSDILQSELFTGCRVGSLAIQLPATGLATIDISFLGAGFTPGTSAYFTSPTAAATTGIAAAVNGALRVGGSDLAIVTGLSLSLTNQLSTEPVVGSNTVPEIFSGTVQVTGQLTAFFENATLRDYFVNETEFDIACRLDLSSAINSDFLNIYLGRVKATSAGGDDGQTGLKKTIAFEGLYKSTGGSGTDSEQTTLSIQDSTL